MWIFIAQNKQRMSLRNQIESLTRRSNEMIYDVTIQYDKQ